MIKVSLVFNLSSLASNADSEVFVLVSSTLFSNSGLVQQTKF